MPQHKSCKKRMRTSAESRLRNRAYRSVMRTAEKKVFSARTRADAEEALQSAMKVLDQLAAKGVVHPNTSANQKSKLARHVRGIAI
ncbi:MAG: 30S ribosomal protein S20 [bacterium]